LNNIKIFLMNKIDFNFYFYFICIILYYIYKYMNIKKKLGILLNYIKLNLILCFLNIS
jgi:hypothetical protein